MTHSFKRRLLLAVLVALTGWSAAWAYPLDGFKETGIRRVEGARLANEGLAEGGKQLPGALWTTDQVDIRLTARQDMKLPATDPAFTEQVVALMGDQSDRYGMAVLDLSDLDNPRYAEHRGDHRQNVGSVNKMLGALGLFQAIADTWPDDLDKRKSILKDTVVTADSFSQSDHHTIRLFNVETRELTRRPMKIGDQGSLWEFLDWTLSVSSNSAAAMIMREAMLIRHFGQEYPVSEEKIQSFFDDTPAAEKTGIFQQTFWEPVTRNGLPLDQIRQGSFFTRGGKARVSGGGLSYATTRTLMEFMLKMEQGLLVDEWSSRQLKRLLYNTERRIRYASAPALNQAAVYFKSGSWYKCQEEEGFTCKPYAGNVFNYMNSVAIVEQDVNGKRIHYLVVVLSNVLRRNGAVDHQALGTGVQELVLESNSGDTAAD